jgi:hypothetical protein
VSRHAYTMPSRASEQIAARGVKKARWPSFSPPPQPPPRSRRQQGSTAGGFRRTAHTPRPACPNRLSSLAQRTPARSTGKPTGRCARREGRAGGWVRRRRRHSTKKAAWELPWPEKQRSLRCVPCPVSPPLIVSFSAERPRPGPAQRPWGAGGGGVMWRCAFFRLNQYIASEQLLRPMPFA